MRKIQSEDAEFRPASSRSLAAAMVLACLAAGCRPAVSPPEDEGPAEGPVCESGYGCLVDAEGAPVEGAEVALVPAGYRPMTDSAGGFSGLRFLETDAQGRYALKGIPAGRYAIRSSKDSLGAFRDSVAIGTEGSRIKPDTLMPTGSVSGRVVGQVDRYEPDAIVQLLGTTVHVRANLSGSFAIAGLAQGDYTALVSSSLPDYDSLPIRFHIRAGERTEIRDMLSIPFLGIPPVKNLHAVFDKAFGVVRLTWDPVVHEDLRGYSVYQYGTLGHRSYKVGATDTAFEDTLYPPGNMPPGQASGISVFYDVRTVDKNRNTSRYPTVAGVRDDAPYSDDIGIDFLLEGGYPGKAPDTLLAGLNHTVKLIVRYSCSYSPIRHTDLGMAGMAGKVFRGRTEARSDTLTLITAGKPESTVYHAHAQDELGRVRLKTVVLKTVSDLPVMELEDQEVQPGGMVHLKAMVRVPYGSLIAYEWDIGNTGEYRSSQDGSFEFTAPSVVESATGCTLRVTNQDGQKVTGAMTVRTVAFEDLPTLPLSFRVWSAKAVVSGERVFMVGGLDSRPDLYGEPHVDYNSYSFEFDSAAYGWVTRNGPSIPRYALGAASLDGKIYVAGGITHTGPTAAVERFDPATGTWETRAPLPAPRAYLELVTLGTRLFAVGPGRTLEEYDPVSDKWKARTPMRKARERPGFFALAGKGGL